MRWHCHHCLNDLMLPVREVHSSHHPLMVPCLANLVKEKIKIECLMNNISGELDQLGIIKLFTKRIV